MIIHFTSTRNIASQLPSADRGHDRGVRHLPRRERQAAVGQALHGRGVQGRVLTASRRGQARTDGWWGCRLAGVNARALADFIGDCRARRLGRELRALGAALYGRRDYDPDQFSSYELRNGVAPDRVKQRAVLAFAHYKENEADMGKSVHGWIELEELLRALPAEKLSVLDHFMENNPNAEWEREVERLRAQMADRDGEV